MKRFVTYLYENRGGQKLKNAGFVRIDIRGDRLSLQLCIRNDLRGNDLGEIFILANPKELMGIKIGDVHKNGNQTDVRFTFQINNIHESGFAFQDTVGIGIRFQNEVYLASCWNDEHEESIRKGEFKVHKIEEIEPMIEVAETRKEEKEDIILEDSRNAITTYRKIELGQLHELPSSNWHLSNNSFLKHGVYNYGFLFLKKKIEDNEESLWLGVPGFYEKPEMLMAVLFGFSDFEAIPKSIVDMEMNIETERENIEKNQEPQTGVFGAWFVKLEQ